MFTPYAGVLCCNSLSNDARFRREDLHVKVCPWCGVGLLRLYSLYCGVVNKLTLLLGSAAPVKRKGARGEVRFPGDPATMCPVLFKGSRSLLLLACCYVPIVRRVLIFKGGT